MNIPLSEPCFNQLFDGCRTAHELYPGEEIYPAGEKDGEAPDYHLSTVTGVHSSAVPVGE